MTDRLSPAEKRAAVNRKPTEDPEGAMLVLSRKLNERIMIGDDIVVTIVKADRKQVRLGIEAPRDVAVYREELVSAKAKGAARNGALVTA